MFVIPLNVRLNLHKRSFKSYKMEYSTLDTKDRILHVARELFILNGYNGTSIRDIAAASGTNVAHIKYYYESKYNLFQTIFDEAFDIFIQRLHLVFSADMPFTEIIDAWIDLYFELLPKYPQIPIFILNEINHSPDALINKVTKSNPEKIFLNLSQKLEEEVKKGTIKNIPIIDLGLNVLSLCVFPFMVRGIVIRVADKSVEEYNEILDEHKKYVKDLVLNGLKP